MSVNKNRSVEKTKIIENLREDGPKRADELPEATEGKEVEVVGVLGVPTPITYETTPVFYLYGQERQAVRKYIQANEDFVRSCMDSEQNPIALNMEEFWFQMFCEEWVWGGRGY